MGENPIALRSKKKLMTALSELMNEKPYREITITELCDRAGLSRPAFYQNFGRIDDVLKRYIEELVRDTLDSENLAPVLTAEELANACMKVITDNSEFFQILIDNDLVGFVIEKCAWVFATLPQTCGNLDENSDQDFKRFYPIFAAAGISTIIASWMSTGKPFSEEKLVSCIKMSLEGIPFQEK
ncbi:MAG: TetR/AcrR family transcriptional regulator [Coriobacteriales bacterium]